MRGGKRQACGLLPRSGKATRSGAAKPRLQAAALQARLSNPVGTAVPSATIEVAGAKAENQSQTHIPLGQSPKKRGAGGLSPPAGVWGKAPASPLTANCQKTTEFPPCGETRLAFPATPPPCIDA